MQETWWKTSNYRRLDPCKRLKITGLISDGGLSPAADPRARLKKSGCLCEENPSMGRSGQILQVKGQGHDDLTTSHLTEKEGGLSGPPHYSPGSEKACNFCHLTV